VHENVIEPFRREMVKTLQDFYGDPTQYNDNLTHIVNRRHLDRLVQAAQTSGGTVVAQGLVDPERLYFGPTLIEAPSLDSQLMKDEIFGPILPFLKVSGPEEAIQFINAREKPLALYVFTETSKIFDTFAQRTSSGAIMQNDTVFHVSSPLCPFGGVGNSGMGQYHGKAGIRALSHMKPVVTHATFVDLDMKYPPYTDAHLSWVTKFA
jgi:aldehyde dehydrogenase (NAD+)